MSNTVEDFAENIHDMGVDITGYDKQDLHYLWKVAKLCSKQAGLPLGLAVGAATSGAGTVTIPLLGAVPGYIAGFLAGSVGGTFACTLSRFSIKQALDQLLSDGETRAKMSSLY